MICRRGYSIVNTQYWRNNLNTMQLQLQDSPITHLFIQLKKTNKETGKVINRCCYNNRIRCNCVKSNSCFHSLYLQNSNSSWYANKSSLFFSVFIYIFFPFISHRSLLTICEQYFLPQESVYFRLSILPCKWYSSLLGVVVLIWLTWHLA
jgi:hypothetical protein